MPKNSDDVPTQIFKRPFASRPRPTPDQHRTDDTPMTAKVVVPNPEQVVTRRISRPNRPGAAAPAADPVTGATQSPAHPAPAGPAGAVAEANLPVGWITVISGPGRGNYLPVFAGMNSLGRDVANRLPVNFGDEAISRADHAFLVFDDEQRKFWIQHGGKSNLVRLNGVPVMAPMPLGNGDMVRVGGTELRFTAFCDDSFDWASTS
ncbi:FHA domain-containing protein [Devosia sp. CN2-171]|uniref:FHA domain-containing protein n=1 Tax=Devosia sp. CN2-171 TaxID=3400909 RepID=UPI003BF86DDB